jgi:hypothetical protein
VASFFGSGNTNTTLTVDKINQTTDLIGKFTNKFDKYFAHPVIHFHACNSLFAIFGYHKYFGNIAKQYHILSQNS